VQANGRWDLTLILLTSTKWWAPANASKWQMGFNSAFKGLNQLLENINYYAIFYYSFLSGIIYPFTTFPFCKFYVRYVYVYTMFACCLDLLCLQRFALGIC
jgi:hypothetical protein